MKEQELRDRFEAFDNSKFGDRDNPPSYETWEAPMLGTRYVETNVQTRFEYFLAASTPLLERIADEENKHQLCQEALVGALTYIGELKELLESAQNGLRWYQAEHPEDASPADDELHERIDTAIQHKEQTNG